MILPETLDHSGMCMVLNQYFWWRPIPLKTSYLGNQNDLQAQKDWLFLTFLGHSRASLLRLIVYFILIIIGRMSYWYVKYMLTIFKVKCEIHGRIIWKILVGGISSFPLSQSSLYFTHIVPLIKRYAVTWIMFVGQVSMSYQIIQNPF